MVSRLIPAKLGGSPRRQEAALSRLHRAFERLEAKQLAAAKQTRTLLTDLMQYSAAELLAGRTGAARWMLKRVLFSHDDEAVDQASDAFLRSDPDGRQEDCLFGSGSLPKPSPTPIVESTIASADAALAEAARIVQAVEDDAIEIDWSDDARTDRERALRLAIIRRIETEEAAFCAKLGWDPAFWTLQKLRKLAPRDAEEIGMDLYDAIERWETALDEARRRDEAAESKRLRDAARQDLEGKPPA